MSDRLTIADIAREPARVAAVPLDALPDLLADLARVQALLFARLVSGNGTGHAVSAPTEPERLLSAGEVAERFSVSLRWCFRHATQIGGLRLSRKRLRFTESGVRRYLARLSR